MNVFKTNYKILECKVRTLNNIIETILNRRDIISVGVCSWSKITTSLTVLLAGYMISVDLDSRKVVA